MTSSEAPLHFEILQDSIGEIHSGEEMDLDPDRCLERCCERHYWRPPSRSSKGLRAASFLEKAVPVESFFLFLELALVGDLVDSVHDSHD